MMTGQVGQKKAGNSGMVSDNHKEFQRGLEILEEHFARTISNDLKSMWLDCFLKDDIVNWVKAVQECIGIFDHFPIPLEVRRIIDRIEGEKFESLIGSQKQASPRALLPERSEDYSEEYRKANLEFISLLASGVGHCLTFRDGKGIGKEKRREIWQETETKVAALQEKYQHLPSNYSCTHCWDSGWAHRPEGDYEMSYPCKCEKGFERQKGIILSTLSEKARSAKQTLSQYLTSLASSTATPFKVKAYPCISVFDAQGKWDFACQHHCPPERIKWCFLQINTIMATV